MDNLLDKFRAATSQALAPVKQKSVIDIIKSDAIERGDLVLVAILERMTKLEIINKVAVEVVNASKELEKHYTRPGPERFQRVVRLRKALDEFERRLSH